ncbi:MAG: hypothetical protein KJZ58_12525 [Flavobacteriales bacterium]|nr:hypothetical protein [Flavobacteriales bacterium]MCL4283075.1 hypothetical protein [Flavobacteriales bacterium]
MNTRKLIGFACWLLALLIPFQHALLSTEDVSNSVGLISFVALVALVFLGYFLVDGASTAEEGHGH